MIHEIPFIQICINCISRFRLLNQSEKTVVAERVEDGGEIRYKITDIIGKEDGLGVENLKGGVVFSIFRKYTCS